MASPRSREWSRHPAHLRRLVTMRRSPRPRPTGRDQSAAQARRVPRRSAPGGWGRGTGTVWRLDQRSPGRHAPPVQTAGPGRTGPARPSGHDAPRTGRRLVTFCRSELRRTTDRDQSARHARRVRRVGSERTGSADRQDVTSRHRTHGGSESRQRTCGGCDRRQRTRGGCASARPPRCDNSAVQRDEAAVTAPAGRSRRDPRPPRTRPRPPCPHAARPRTPTARRATPRTGAPVRAPRVGRCRGTSSR